MARRIANRVATNAQSARHAIPAWPRLQGLRQGTIIALVLTPPSTGGTQYICSFAASGGYRRLFRSGTDTWRFQADRATTDLSVEATQGTFAASSGNNKPILIAAGWDLDGVAADQYLAMGNPRRLAEPPSSYTTQTVGSGSEVAASGNNNFLGDGSTGSYQQSCALLALFNYRMPLGHVHRFQRAPRPSAGCLGFWISGGHEQFLDLQNGNHSIGIVGSGILSSPATTEFLLSWVTDPMIAQRRSRRFYAPVGAPPGDVLPIAPKAWRNPLLNR